MLIYVAHPYGGLEENKQSVEEKIKALVKKYPNHTFISPIHTFGYMYHFVDNYNQGIQMCVKLLTKCDMLVLCENWENSKGCRIENARAKIKGIPIKTYEEMMI